MEKLTISTPDLLNFSEAAKLLGVARSTVYNLLARHRLHPVVIGRNRYLLRTEVEDLKRRAHG